MARKNKSRGSITKPAYVVDLKGWPSPVASERRLDPSMFRNWKPECRGDVVETVADLFRYLRRAREYLVEADRQLRVEELTDDEHAAREAWYNDMDANDEWTGVEPDAHVDAARKIIDFFDLNPTLVQAYDTKPFIVANADGTSAWQPLKISETIVDLRRDIAALLVRIAPHKTSH